MIERLRSAPLVASVQADDDSPLCSPEIIARLALASVQQGVGALRLQGIENIRAVRAVCSLPMIGLIKRSYPGSEVYITPTAEEVRQLATEGVQVIALDGTARNRPSGDTLPELVKLIHECGCLAMADCDEIESVHFSLAAGADFIGTTLAGYTGKSAITHGPDLEFLRVVLQNSDKPVIAEGRFTDPAQVQCALRMGAVAVVVGGALNDPWKRTRAFAQAARPRSEKVGAVDLGGTWLRFGVFERPSPARRGERGRPGSAVGGGEGGPSGLVVATRIPLPSTANERLDWIRSQAEESQVKIIGVSSGGVIHPRTGIVTEAKAIVPDHVGTEFSENTLGVETIALNDGLATAWGHACHPRYAGKRVATLALGTGVGAGLVDRGRLILGPEGDYPRINDLPFHKGTVEDALGGADYDPILADEAAHLAYEAVQKLWQPDVVVICGGVGLSGRLEFPGADLSPHGEDAGLYGAAALALYPPGLEYASRHG